MFNMFPKFGSFGDCVNPEDLISKQNNNVYPTWTWTTGIKDEEGKDISVTDLIQKYNNLLKENQELKNDYHQPELCNEKIAELTKEVLQLRHLKQENADLLEMLAKYRDGYQGSCYACEPVGILNQKQEKEIEKLNLQITALHKIIEGAKTKIDNQKHPMYPIHWGGYTDETPWETAAADLALRVVKLEKKVEELKLINTSLFVNKKHDK